MEENWDRSS